MNHQEVDGCKQWHSGPGVAEGTQDTLPSGTAPGPPTATAWEIHQQHLLLRATGANDGSPGRIPFAKFQPSDLLLGQGECVLSSQPLVSLFFQKLL